MKGAFPFMEGRFPRFIVSLDIAIIFDIRKVGDHRCAPTHI